MKMSRSVWIHISLAIVIALAALFFINLRNAGGVSSFLGNELPSLSTEG
jgi:flagellar basal body-associated protein FliL